MGAVLRQHIAASQVGGGVSLRVGEWSVGPGTVEELTAEIEALDRAIVEEQARIVDDTPLLVQRLRAGNVGILLLLRANVAARRDSLTA